MSGPDTTLNQAYPRPDPDHSARADATRIATAIDMIDADVAATKAAALAMATALDDIETLMLALE